MGDGLKHVSNVVLSITFIFLVVLAGCGSDELGDSDNNLSTSQKNITIFGGSVGGVWSIFTEGIAETVRKENQDMNVSVIPGTVAGNPVAVAQGKADLAIAESLTALFAYEGTGPFDESYENIRAVASVIPINVFQFVAPKNAPFDSVEEFVNNKTAIRYSAGEKDALGDKISASIFDAYKFSYDGIDAHGGSVDFLSGSKSFELMADNRMDGLGKMAPIPAGDILEASATMDLKLIPIGETAINHLMELYEMTPYTMEAGSYEFQKEDYYTVNTPTILITNTEMDEDTVYQITKSIYNQLDYLTNVHNGFKQVNDETIVEVGGVPLHPGAKKFFREAGLLE